MIAGLFGFQFLGALYLQQVLGYNVLQTGLAFLAVTGAIAAASAARHVLIPGLVLIAAALLLLTQAPADGNYFVHVLPAMLLLGVGAGLVMPAVMGKAMSGAAAEDSGLARGLVNTTQQVGAAVGLAVLSTVAASRVTAEMPTTEALTSGFQLAFGAGAGIIAAAILVATVLKFVLKESSVNSSS